MQNGGPLLTVDDLWKSYESGSGRRIEVLKGARLTLAAGETAAVIGASGIGKSTLLHILGALDRPDQGTVRFGPTDIFQMPEIELARFRNRSIGFIFQFHHLLPEFDTVENVMIPMLIQGIPANAARADAVSILERVGLGDRIEHRVNRLSGGEQQRVALARALVLKPPLLLADEPTGNLDRESSRQIHRLLTELNEELRMTLLVVTHNPELAAIMDRRISIVEGQLMDVART